MSSRPSQRRGPGLCLLLLLLAAPLGAQDGPAWLDSLDAAKREARTSRRPVLCVVYEPGERNSERLFRDFERSAAIRALLPRFVCVRLDRARHADLSERYGLKYVPSTLFLTFLGSPLKLVSGPVSAAKYASQMEEALEKHAGMFRAPEAPAERPAPKRTSPAGAPEFPVHRHAPRCPVDCEFCVPAIDRAVAWLVARQRPDGRFEKPAAERVVTNEEGQVVTRSIDHIDVALTSLAGLALLAGGSTPSGGPMRAEVARAARFVAGAVREDGIASNKAGHDFLYLVHCNFETSLAALFLAEVERLDPDPDRRAALGRILRYLAGVQEPSTGAWGYAYDFREFSPWDRRGWRLLATTHVALSALEAGRDAGLPVSPTAIERGARYLLACRGADGAFTYRAEYREREGDPGSTAGALLALARSGVVPAETLESIRARQRRDYRRIDHYGEHWWWFLLFTALAMNDDSEGGIAEFDSYYRDLLLSRQAADGSFSDPDDKGGSVYATAIAAIVLQLRLGRLPIAGARSKVEAPIDVVGSPRYLAPPHDLSRVKVFRHGDGYRFDLVVSVDGEPDAEWLQALAEGIVGANRTIFDVLDGQLMLNRAEIRVRRERWEEADVLVGPEFREADENPHPFAHGVTRVSKRTRIVNGRETEGLRIGDYLMLPPADPEGGGAIRWDDPRSVHVLAHELGHYLLGGLDEYDTRTGESRCDCLMGRRRWTELCTDAVHSDPRTPESCWAHARALYPALVVPAVPDPGPWLPPRPRVEIVR